jgi:hypothetical protein
MPMACSEKLLMMTIVVRRSWDVRGCQGERGTTSGVEYHRRRGTGTPYLSRSSLALTAEAPRRVPASLISCASICY